MKKLLLSAAALLGLRRDCGRVFTKLFLGVLCLSSLFTCSAAHEPLTLKELTLQTVLTNFTPEKIAQNRYLFDSVTTSKVLKKMQMAAILHDDIAKRDLAHPENLGAEKVTLLKDNGLWDGISIQDLYDNQATRHLLNFNNDFGEITLDLSNLFITSLEGLVNIPGLDTVQSLFLYSNQLTTLAADTFSNLPQLRILGLNNNQLTTLAAGTFTNLPQLRILDLSNNQLTALAAGTFTNLPQLERLYLENNQLTTLAVGAFSNLPQLKELDLENNQLTTLAADTFSNLPQLRHLSLDHNQLTTVAAGAFSNLPQLKELYLDHNQLTTVAAGAFSNLPQLGRLHLSGSCLLTEDQKQAIPASVPGCEVQF